MYEIAGEQQLQMQRRAEVSGLRKRGERKQCCDPGAKAKPAQDLESKILDRLVTSRSSAAEQVTGYLPAADGQPELRLRDNTIAAVRRSLLNATAGRGERAWSCESAPSQGFCLFPHTFPRKQAARLWIPTQLPFFQQRKEFKVSD